MPAAAMWPSSSWISANRMSLCGRGAMDRLWRSDQQHRWRALGQQPCHAGMRGVKVNMVSTLASSVQAGLGVTALPCFIGDQMEDLVRINTLKVPSDTGLWVLTHPDLKKAARVRAFLDFFGTELTRRRRLVEGDEVATAP